MAIAPHDFVVDVCDCDSDAVMTNTTTAIVEDPDTGHSSIEPIVVIISDENVESSIEEKQVIYTSETVQTKSSVEIEENKPKNKKKGKTASLNRNEEGRQAIINSNTEFKKKQLAMLEAQHFYQNKMYPLLVIYSP
ncbi:unnamed protein product [Arctia plantaginis]|nr:unnamed protein product [Arctia plantaginis]